MNVTSVSTLGKYLATGMPVVERTITVDGDACAKPQNIVVPVGTAYQDIIDFAGVKGELGKVVAGGAMMGPAVENLSYPTTKTTSGLIFLSKAAAEPAPVNPCIAAAAAWSTAPWVWSLWRSIRHTLHAMCRSWASCMQTTASTAAAALSSARQSALLPR